jgi:hypothetical protein
MRKLVILLLIIGAYSQLFAQLPFQKYYFSTATNKYAHINTISSEGYFICRQVVDSGLTYFEIDRVNEFGDTLWTKSDYTSFITNYYSVLKINDNHFVVCGDKKVTANTGNGVLLNIDSSGNVISNISYAMNVFESIYFVAPFNNGNLFLTGKAIVTNKHIGSIAKVDSIGNLFWGQTFTNDFDSYVHASILGDNSFIITKHDTYSNSTIVRLDSSANLLWQKSYSGSAITINPSMIVDSVITTAGFYVNDSINYLEVKKFEYTGNAISTRTYNFPFLSEVNEIIPTSDYGCLLVGYSFSDFFNSEAVVYKLDSTYNTEWIKTISNFPLEKGTTAIQLSDHEYTIMGNVNSFGNDTGGFSLTGIDTIRSIVNVNNSLTSPNSCLVFPNPFEISTRVFISKDPTNGKLNLELINSLGKSVVVKKDLSKEFTFYRNNLSPGLYYYRIYDSKSNICTGKLIVQ